MDQHHSFHSVSHDLVRTESIDSTGDSPLFSKKRRIAEARLHLRVFLDSIHILESLVGRTSVVTLDSSLSLEKILVALLEKDHHHASAWTPPESSSSGTSGGGTGRGGGGSSGGGVADPRASDHGRGSAVGDGGWRTEISLGTPSPALPTVVLGEVCSLGESGAGLGESGAGVNRRRGGASPDRGDSLQGGGKPLPAAGIVAGRYKLSVVEDQSQCRLIKPLTVNEVSRYLEELQRLPEEAFSWSLDKWRRHSTRRAAAGKGSSPTTSPGGSPSGGSSVRSAEDDAKNLYEAAPARYSSQNRDADAAAVEGDRCRGLFSSFFGKVVRR